MFALSLSRKQKGTDLEKASVESGIHRGGTDLSGPNSMGD
ncbi:hypothetical protein THTE_2778 [Thermogutta terrifontis]|uniref:Uncharacterized protein n=1 Tax=Thermogutta terrifontis TaxID=1331910 RepID=A0A286RHF1_9BACT|nr:hypothetical protein THTE_2778 [Thermogutta terrifontis]